MAYINIDDFHPEAGDDAARINWFPVNALPNLAFDHDKVLLKALSVLETKAVI
jgi:8-oxo-dGTP diphosphatase